MFSRSFVGNFKMNSNMSPTIWITLTLTLCVFTKVVTGVTECNTVDQCSCQFDDGSMMDLTSLGNTDNSPRFEDVLASSEGNYYSYNPCGGFTERDCTKAATCVSNPTKEESIQIGDASSAKFKYDASSGAVVAGYTAGNVGRLLLSEVLLMCDQSASSPTFSAQGQQEGGFFQMTLTTVCACPGGCSASGPTGNGGGGISVGSILLIVFFVLLLIYVGLGTVLMKFVKKKEGIEIIPNILFWKTLPIKIKDGTRFVFGLCIPKCRQDSYISK